MRRFRREAGAGLNHAGPKIFPIELGNEAHADLFRTHGLAFILIAAGTEAVPGTGATFNQELEYAGRAADFLEFADLLCLDALAREESCGAHFREEYQTPEGDPRRDDERFAHVAAWEYAEGSAPRLHKEPLTFEFVPPSSRNYR